MKNIKELRKIEFERREKKLQNASAQRLLYNKKNKNNMVITYVMTWTGICGGSKIILEHANRLTERGNFVNIISHDNKPDWFEMNDKINFIQVPWDEVLCEKIPECDVVVATYWREIYECVEQQIAPVIYFEQGDYHLFDLEKLENRVFEYIKKQLSTVKFVYTVSSYAKNKIDEIYGTNAEIIPNAVDNKVFFYKKTDNKETDNKKITITVIGAEKSTFKRINNIIEAVKTVKDKGYDVDFNWITPQEPEAKYGNVIINPPQYFIGETLRNSDIYICASMYESFCLPVLEAMTCGAAVITTNNGGNMDFVKDGKNALVIEKDNINDIIEKIEFLINNDEFRKKIASNGVETSKKYSWNNTIDKIEEYYRECANYDVIKES